MGIIERFRSFKEKGMERYGELFKKLAFGQKPWALVISCSDSRIIPELIFDAAPGELFVLRNIANIVPPYDSEFSGVIAPIEYAVGHLGVKNIVVLGHSMCGGVKAILEGYEGENHLARWLSLRSSLKRCSSQEEAERVNVRLSVEELLKYPVVNRAIKERGVVLEGYYYRFEEFTLEKVV